MDKGLALANEEFLMFTKFGCFAFVAKQNWRRIKPAVLSIKSQQSLLFLLTSWKSEWRILRKASLPAVTSLLYESLTKAVRNTLPCHPFFCSTYFHSFSNSTWHSQDLEKYFPICAANLWGMVPQFPFQTLYPLSQAEHFCAGAILFRFKREKYRLNLPTTPVWGNKRQLVWRRTNVIDVVYWEKMSSFISLLVWPSDENLLQNSPQALFFEMEQLFSTFSIIVWSAIALFKSGRGGFLFSHPEVSPSGWYSGYKARCTRLRK